MRDNVSFTRSRVGSGPVGRVQCVSLSRCLAALWAWFIGSLQPYDINRRMALLCVLLLSIRLLNGDCQDGNSPERRPSTSYCIERLICSDLVLYTLLLNITPASCSRLECIVTQEGHSCIMYTLLHLLLISTKREGCPPISPDFSLICINIMGHQRVRSLTSVLPSGRRRSVAGIWVHG